MKMALILAALLLAGLDAAYAKNHPDVDRAIDTAIRGACGKMDGNLTAANLAKVTQLDLANNPVKDIKPLARLQRLRSVSLQGSKVTSLKPLGALPTLHEVKLIGIAMLAVPEIRKLQNDLPKLNISHNATSTYIRFTNKTRQPILISWVNHS